MKYKICYKSKLNQSYSDSCFDYVEFTDRLAALHYVWDNMADLERFSDNSGSIFGYMVQLDEAGKPTAILYNHRIDGLIWIDYN